eukprot:1675253-Amphidinium_carterae.2
MFRSKDCTKDNCSFLRPVPCSQLNTAVCSLSDCFPLPLLADKLATPFQHQFGALVSVNHTQHQNQTLSVVATWS